MAMGRPRKPGGPADRKDPRKLVVLEFKEDAEIPKMADPHQWLPVPPDVQEGDDYFDPEFDWAEPVKQWWHDIWSSPMASEFFDSDIHGLHMACVYLPEGLSPYYTPSDRLKSLTSFEATIKNFGLTPVSRENLRWAVSQGEQAQNRTNQLRSQASNTPQEGKKSRNEIDDLYAEHG